MRRPPAEFALRLLVRAGAHLRHHRDHVLAGDQPSDPRRDVQRRPRAEHRGKRGQPIFHLRGLVVDDIVDLAGLATIDRRDSRGRRISDMQERPPAAAVAEQRHAAATYQLDH
jgi:hypothetical protein